MCHLWRFLQKLQCYSTGSNAVQGDELLIADDHGLQDIDRHLPKALRSDVKACAQCGVTKTPQWREGPHGMML